MIIDEADKGKKMQDDRIRTDNIINIGDSVNFGNQNLNLETNNGYYQEHHTEFPWIFLTGACGYIGSHLSAHLKSNTSYNLMQIDLLAKNLSHTTRYCDIFADEDFSSDVVLQSINQYKPHTVIHFAASSTIGPGQLDPIGYWYNNVNKTIKLLETCVHAGVKNFIFASTSSVYDDMAVLESSPVNPITAYARTKYAIEMALRDCHYSYGLNCISFRFFNAAGSHPFYDLGELYGSSHLVAKIMESIVHKTTLTVFGKDYETEDGTAVRDYTHVMDIVDAVSNSIEWLDQNPGCHVFNLGSGQGNSVQSVIDRTEQILNTSVPYRYGPRRDGDSAFRIADINMAKNILGWSPNSSLDDIIKDSFKWYNSSIYKDLYIKKVWYDNK